MYLMPHGGAATPFMACYMACSVSRFCMDTTCGFVLNIIQEIFNVQLNSQCKLRYNMSEDLSLLGKKKKDKQLKLQKLYKTTNEENSFYQNITFSKIIASLPLTTVKGISVFSVLIIYVWKCITATPEKKTITLSFMVLQWVMTFQFS